MNKSGGQNAVRDEMHSYRMTNGGSTRYPVLIAVPHAARDYPAALTENLRVPADVLLRLEDRYADLLARRAASEGFAVIRSTRPRAWIDMNRAPDDIDPSMLSDIDPGKFSHMSVKAQGGLGLVPARLSGVGDLWRHKWTWADFADRIATCHTPYHARIAEWLDAAAMAYGGAALIDLHSMPSLPITDDGPSAQIVIGDRFSRSAASRLSDAALGLARGAGLHTRLNHPYAGGYTLDRHGRPQRNVHAIQIEIDRALYLDNVRA